MNVHDDSNSRQQSRHSNKYSKLSGFSAINTKPYRPIGNLDSVLQLKRINKRKDSKTSDLDNTNHSNDETQSFHVFMATSIAKNKFKQHATHVPRVRFSNKEYGHTLKPRLQQRTGDVRSLKIGATANGGIFSFVRAPHALELTEHTARHAFHVATQKYGGTSRTHHHRIHLGGGTGGMGGTRETGKTGQTGETGETAGRRGTEGTAVKRRGGPADDELDEYNEEDDEDDEVRLKTRNEIWAETHLANVQNDLVKVNTPKRLKSKFIKVDTKFRNDIQSARIKKARGGKAAPKGLRNSAWRNKRLQKQLDEEEENNSESVSTPRIAIVSPGASSALHTGSATSSPMSKKKKPSTSLVPPSKPQSDLPSKTKGTRGKEEHWVCFECGGSNLPTRKICYKCGAPPRNGGYSAGAYPVRPANQSPGMASAGLTARRARRRSSVSRLDLAKTIFQEILPDGEKDESSDDEIDFSGFSQTNNKPKPKSVSVKSSSSSSSSSPSSKIPSYVSNKQSSKHVGGGLAGLNVAYEQSQDPFFWEHYSREMVGTVRKGGSPNKNIRGRKDTDQTTTITGNSGERLVGKDIDYENIVQRVNKSIVSRERLRKNLKGIGAWQKNLFENYQRDLEALDIKRVDVLRQGTMVARADQFLDRVIREAYTANKAMSMVRGAANEIDRAQTQINRSRVKWYDEVEAEQPLSRPHHMMKTLLLELCHSGYRLNNEIFYHSVINTYCYCGTRACNADGPFQILIKKMREVLSITTGEYVEWLSLHKMPVPRVLLAELQQEELDRREMEEENRKMQLMLDNDGIQHKEVTTSICQSALVRPVGLPPNVLSVQVLRARKLLPADLDGYADPLVYCWLAPMWGPEGFIPEHTQREHTHHCSKTLNPIWEDLSKTFQFEVTDEFWGLSIAVYDHDEHGDNDVMAYCRVGLNVVRSHNYKTERWFTLKFPPANLGDYEGLGSRSTHTKIYFGEIKLKLEWFNRELKEYDRTHERPRVPPQKSSEGSSSEDESNDEKED